MSKKALITDYLKICHLDTGDLTEINQNEFVKLYRKHLEDSTKYIQNTTQQSNLTMINKIIKGKDGFSAKVHTSNSKDEILQKIDYNDYKLPLLLKDLRYSLVKQITHIDHIFENLVKEGFLDESFFADDFDLFNLEEKKVNAPKVFINNSQSNTPTVNVQANPTVNLQSNTPVSAQANPPVNVQVAAKPVSVQSPAKPVSVNPKPANAAPKPIINSSQSTPTKPNTTSQTATPNQTSPSKPTNPSKPNTLNQTTPAKTTVPNQTTANQTAAKTPTLKTEGVAPKVAANPNVFSKTESVAATAQEESDKASKKFKLGSKIVINNSQTEENSLGENKSNSSAAASNASIADYLSKSRS